MTILNACPRRGEMVLLERQRGVKSCCPISDPVGRCGRPANLLGRQA